jgi:hypothetical protein
MFYNKNMRIKNKYLRNRLFKTLTRNRVKQFIGGEFSYKQHCPWWSLGLFKNYTSEEQLKDHQNHIDEWWVRGILNGKKGGYHAPKWYRSATERRQRRKVKKVIDKMTENIDNVDDYVIPNFKQDADWDWF